MSKEPYICINQHSLSPPADRHIGLHISARNQPLSAGKYVIILMTKQQRSVFNNSKKKNSETHFRGESKFYCRPNFCVNCKILSSIET